MACIFLNCNFFQDICPGVGLLGHILVLYLVLRNLHTVLDNVVAIDIPTNSAGGSLLSTPSLAFIVYWFFWWWLFLTNVMWYLIVVLICNFLIINDAEYLFMYSFVISMSFLEKCPFRFSAHHLFIYLFLLGCMSCL